MRACVAAVIVAASIASLARAHDPRFPAPGRPVAPIVSPRWSTEAERDRVGEAGRVIAALGPLAGRTVADVGAGEGYYEPYLSRAVGPHGRVIAEDIDTATVAKLARRVRRLGNVRTTLGRADNVGLARGSVDVVVMIHMYHEITQPYALLWRVRAGLRPGGRVAVVDADRPTVDHGTPPTLLTCELGVMGFARTTLQPIGDGAYVAIFVPRAMPRTITPCR